MMIVDTVENLIIGDRFYFVNESYFTDFIEASETEIPLDSFDFFLLEVLPSEIDEDYVSLRVVGIDATLDCKSAAMIVLPVHLDEHVWIDGSDDSTAILREYLKSGGSTKQEVKEMLGLMFGDVDVCTEEDEYEEDEWK